MLKAPRNETRPLRRADAAHPSRFFRFALRLLGVNVLIFALTAEWQVRAEKPDLIELLKRCEEGQSPKLCPQALVACKQVLEGFAKEKPQAGAIPILERVLVRSAICEHSLGDYDAAHLHYYESVRLADAFYGSRSTQLADRLSLLASLNESKGNYVQAERLIRHALQILHEQVGPQDVRFATGLSNLATILSAQGRLYEAESLYTQAAKILVEKYGREHPDIATLLDLLGLFYTYSDRDDLAEQLLREALRQKRKLLSDKDDPSIAHSLNNLALALHQRGKFAEAETLFLEALAILKKHYGQEHLYVASTINNLGGLLDDQGKHVEGLARYNEALVMLKHLLGPLHPLVATNLNNQGRTLLALGRTHEAATLFAEGGRIREVQLRTTVSEIRMKALLEAKRIDEDAVYAALLSGASDPALPQLALTMTLLRKGRAAEAGTQANRLMHRNLKNPTLLKQFEQWQKLRQQSDALYFGGMGGLTPDEYQKKIRDLHVQTAAWEAGISTSLPELEKLQPPDFATIVSTVAKALPRDGVLVEIVWARPYRAEAKPPESHWGAPHYVAILLFSDKRIVTQDLGDAGQIDRQVLRLREALGATTSDPVPPARSLYDNILRPLLRYLPEHHHLYLSLDRTLHLVPFDALHDEKDYLLGRYRFHYLTSGRDLLLEPTKRPSGAPLLLANPDYGKQEPTKYSAEKPNFYQKLSLLPLPGTQIEANALGPLLGVRALVGSAASEAAVRNGGTPRILHIATHGLFLSDVDTPMPLDENKGMATVSAVRDRSKNVAAPSADQLPGESGAMNRSALALAGVMQGSRAASTAEDGLLTAEEARSLDLEGTQLVVLSACDTGQGGLSAGQGVYGLRRAFLVAGAETLVTSLWRVSDDSTGELMALYYRKLLDKQQPGDRLGAMADAMQELRSRPKRSHPYFWAPFLVIGQDGPLRP